ncbi:MAG: pseudouridine synthase [Gammaproteobacteria bacterium]|nr:pseudouridine synthase [Gammaproteobacteria bacterium]
MSNIILFNKPFGVLSQFTGEADQLTLASYIDKPGFYAAGRLDRDSEGLMLLTNDGKLQQKVSNPKYNKSKTYLVQLEGDADEEALSKLRAGLELKDGMTRKAEARLVSEPDLWPRTPPIRERKNIPTSWIELSISEGRNRQVRRMTAAVGYPTLRLIRVSIDSWELGDLLPGEWKLLQA